MKLKVSKNLPILVAAMALSLGTATLQAQEAAPQAQSAKKAHATQAEQLETLASKYGLSDEQKQKASAILDEDAKEMAAIRKDKTLTKEDRKAKMSELRKHREEKIRAILTPEQLKKHGKGHVKKDAGNK